MILDSLHTEIVRNLLECPMRRLYLVKTEGLPYQIGDSWQEFSLSMEKRKVEKEKTGCVSDGLAPLAQNTLNTFHFLPLQALTLPPAHSPRYRHPTYPLLYTSARHARTHTHTHSISLHIADSLFPHCQLTCPLSTNSFSLRWTQALQHTP